MLLLLPLLQRQPLKLLLLRQRLRSLKPQLLLLLLPLRPHPSCFAQPRQSSAASAHERSSSKIDQKLTTTPYVACLADVGGAALVERAQHDTVHIVDRPVSHAAAGAAKQAFSHTTRIRSDQSEQRQEQQQWQ